jgi:hypothetical protein
MAVAAAAGTTNNTNSANNEINQPAGHGSDPSASYRYNSKYYQPRFGTGSASPNHHHHHHQHGYGNSYQAGFYPNGNARQPFNNRFQPFRPYNFFNRPFQYNQNGAQNMNTNGPSTTGLMANNSQPYQMRHGGQGDTMSMMMNGGGGTGEVLSNRMFMAMMSAASAAAAHGHAEKKLDGGAAKSAAVADEVQFDNDSSSSSGSENDGDDELALDYALADLKVTVGESSSSCDDRTNAGRAVFNELFNNTTSDASFDVGELLLATVGLEEAYVTDESIKSTLTHPNGYLKQWDLLETLDKRKSRRQRDGVDSERRRKEFMLNFIYSQRVLCERDDAAVAASASETSQFGDRRAEVAGRLLAEANETLTSLSKELWIKTRLEKEFSHVTVKGGDMSDKFSQFSGGLMGNNNACLKNCLSLLGSENLLNV